MYLIDEVLKAASLSPATDAAGRTGLYVTLKNSVWAYVVYYLDQGNAATIALTPQQAKDISGTGAKAIPAVPIWLNNDMAASSVLVKQADAASFTTDATTKKKLVVFQIEPARLDINSGFITVAAQTGASNAANVTSALVEVMPRLMGATTLNAMVN